MTLAPTDVDTRFDRTIDRWFRDQLAISPEGATFLGLHDHDGDLSSGGRDAIDKEVAFYRRTIDELSAIETSRGRRRANIGRWRGCRSGPGPWRRRGRRVFRRPIAGRRRSG